MGLLISNHRANNVQKAYNAAKKGKVRKLIKLLKYGIDVNYKYELDWTLLHLASQYGHVTVVKELLNYGADIDAKSILGYTPLHDAAFFGHKDIVTDLLNNGANNNLSTNEGYTALHLASWNGNLEIVSKFLKQQVDINKTYHNGSTPLQLSSKNGHLNITSKLIKHGADVNFKNENDDTSLIYASQNGHVTTVTELIKHGADVNFKNENDDTSLIFASQNGHVTIVTELIKHGADVNFKNENDDTPLIFASQNGHVTIVTELIKHGAYINFKNKDDNTPLIYASENGHVTTVTELIKHGADVNFKNKNGHMQLIYASQNGHVTTVCELIKHGADVNLSNEDDITPLHFASLQGYFSSYTVPNASREGHVTIVTELVKHGADVNFKNKNNETPLHFASQFAYDVDIIIELIKHGADVNFKNKDDNTPLHAASNVKIANELIKHGADINFKNKDNLTPLHCASRTGRVNIVTELIKHGADVNFKDRNDDSPLHLASSAGHMTTVTELIKHGADVNSKNIQNETPLFSASSQSHLPVINELLKHGGDLNFKIDPEKSFLCWASENGYDIRDHELLVEPLLNKILSDSIYTILSELYLHNLPACIEPVLQTVVILFINIFSFSKLYSHSSEINQRCDIELFFIKLFGFGFMKEFISTFENIITTEKTLSNTSKINLPGIGNITDEELLQTANQFYDLPNDFCNFFLPNFQKLFKFACTSKSHDFQIFGPDFMKYYHPAVESFMEEYKYSVSFAGLKLEDVEIFYENLTHNIRSIGFQNVLSQIGGAITGMMIGLIEPKFLQINKYSLNDEKIEVTRNHIITTRDDACYLQNELLKLLVHNFITQYHPPHIKVYNSFEFNSCSADLDIQGSAGEGFLIYGKDKSDIDFIYPLTVFNTSLKFNKLITCPDAPAYVMIDVTPDLSECKNEIEKQLLLANLKFRNESYFLNIKQQKQLIGKHVTSQLNSSSDHEILVNPDDDKCFRIQFFYDEIPVIINHLTSHISNLSKFSDSLVETMGSKLSVQIFLKDISGKYYVSKQNWKYFQNRLKLFEDGKVSNSLHPQDIPSSSKENSAKIEVFNIDVEIETRIHIIIDNIISFMQFLGTSDVNLKFLANIEEEIFYVLMLILISCGLYTIIPIILYKNIEFRPSPADVEINCISNEPVFFFTEDLYRIRNTDPSSIGNKNITQKQKEIETYIIAALIWIKYHIKKIYNNLNNKDMAEAMSCDAEVMSCDEHEFTIYTNKNLIQQISTSTILWHSSIISLIIEFLKIVKTIIKYNTMFNPTVTEENKHMFEVVPGLKFEEWPIIASSWQTRKRFWPEPEVVQRMINNGFYVVFKSFKQNGYDGRISFSSAEKIICHAMTKEQRSVFYYLKTRFKLINTKLLTSYHIKSLCFWVFESMPSVNNSEDIIKIYIEAIISKLFTALQDHMLSHYFIPEHNLLMDLTDEDFKEINKGIKHFIENQGFETSKNYQSYDRRETNIEFLFKLVQNSFFKSIEQYLKNI